MADEIDDATLVRFRPWLYAAAVYNAAWGTAAVLAPTLMFGWVGMAPPTPTAIWRCVGMFVLLYAPAYTWAARRPAAHAPLVLLGAAGKVLGPLGFLWAAATGDLPWRFGVLLLGNDVVWWPAFALYLGAAAQVWGGWAHLVRGGDVSARCRAGS